jgi:hypothetical protein
VSSFPALDVAIGLAFLYFVLALVCSALNETVAGVFKWRAQELEKAIWQILRSPEAEQQFFSHPLIQAAIDQGRKSATLDPAVTGSVKLRQRFRSTFTRYRRYPSYLHARTAIEALLDLGPTPSGAAPSDTPSPPDGTAPPRIVPESLRTPERTGLEAAIQAIGSEPTQRVLTAIFKSTGWDPVKFRQGAERWYDDQMERVSGWYRRRVQWWIFFWALLVAFALNADTFRIAHVLWTQPSVRSALVNQANATVSGAQGPTGATGTGTTGPTGAQSCQASCAVDKLRSLPVPLGWHFKKRASDPQGFPFRPWRTYDFFAKLLGLLLTTFALSLGAPFWFDTLSKIARLRNSGAPPAATQAVRIGEGEETRAG